MKMVRMLFVFTLVASLFSSCSKENERLAPECLEGTIQWTGNPAADGLGWTLVVNPENPTYYVLKNLPITYQQDNLEVTVCIYKTGEKVSCFCQEPKDEYAVASIKRR